MLNVEEVILNIFLLGLALSALPILLAGAILMFESSSEAMIKAKNIIKNVIIGYIIILTAYILFSALSEVEVEPFILFKPLVPSIPRFLSKFSKFRSGEKSELEIDTLRSLELKLHGKVPVNCIEVKRTWLDKPFCAGAIYEGDGGYIYCVFEPWLDDELRSLVEYVKSRIFEVLPKVSSNGLKGNEKDFFNAFNLVMSGLGLDLESKARVWYYVERDCLKAGPITPLLLDPLIEDITCSGYDKPVYVYHSEFGYIPTNIKLSEEELDDFVLSTAQKAGVELSFTNPTADTTLYDGSRVYITFKKDVTDHGSSFTIRKVKKQPMSPAQLIALKTFSVDEFALIWEGLESKFNILFVGETASGKTTAMNASAMLIDPNAKIVSIEDTREIILPHKNWTPCIAGKKSVFELVKESLRQRPEYIIVGEVRGEEAYALFQAMSLGHSTLSTFHGFSARGVIERLRGPPFNVPENMIQFLDLIVVLRKIRFKSRMVRRCIGIWHLINSKKLNCVFKWNYRFDYHEKVDLDSVLKLISRKSSLSVSEVKIRISDKAEKLREEASYYVERDYFY